MTAFADYLQSEEGAGEGSRYLTKLFSIFNDEDSETPLSFFPSFSRSLPDELRGLMCEAIGPDDRLRTAFDLGGHLDQGIRPPVWDVCTFFHLERDGHERDGQWYLARRARRLARAAAKSRRRRRDPEVTTIDPPDGCHAEHLEETSVSLGAVGPGVLPPPLGWSRQVGVLWAKLRWPVALPPALLAVDRRPDTPERRRLLSEAVRSFLEGCVAASSSLTDRTTEGSSRTSSPLSQSGGSAYQSGATRAAGSFDLDRAIADGVIIRRRGSTDSGGLNLWELDETPGGCIKGREERTPSAQKAPQDNQGARTRSGQETPPEKWTRELANSPVARQLAKNPHATIDEIKEATGIPRTTVYNTTAWKNRDRRPGKDKCVRTRPLTDVILASRGVSEDPSETIDIYDLLRNKYLNTCRPGERAEFFAKSKEDQRALLDLFAEQLEDAEEEEKPE
jgi:hypothetical protein